ncbi:unnamed protein product [Ostreobium quekettii]|uniref:Kinesin light chain n=1 Tax=Ostreobium quekettii TaxID=121088 RepID=A0A8S1IL38_9CHLO|nr:unnamed protein product [Ostreobium quekettii]|eukprot:evm.model.scf_135.11 EVM.evm.TU.scf_135.11   scf_135:92820-95763(-)
MKADLVPITIGLPQRSLSEEILEGSDLGEAMEMYQRAIYAAVDALCPETASLGPGDPPHQFGTRFREALRQYSDSIHSMAAAAGDEDKKRDGGKLGRCQPELAAKLTSGGATGTSESESAGQQHGTSSREQWIQKASFRKQSTISRAYASLVQQDANPDKDIMRALELYQNALDVLKKFYGEHHPHVATATTNMGNFLWMEGELDKAMEFYAQAQYVFEKAPGVDDLDLAAVYTNIGNLLQAACNRHVVNCGQEREELEEAQEFHERALSILERQLGHDSLDVAAAGINLADIMEAQGNHSDAASEYTAALETLKVVKGPEHTDIAHVSGKLAGCLQAMGEFHKALQYHNMALKVWQGAGELANHNIAITYLNIAGILQSEGLVDDAIDLYRQALENTETKLGAEHHLVALICTQLSKVLQGKGELTESMEQLDRALGIRDKVLAASVASLRPEQPQAP